MRNMRRTSVAVLVLALSLVSLTVGQRFRNLGEDQPWTQIKVACATTAGDFTVTLSPDFSPRGVGRFLTLVDAGFFTDMLLYRVISGFLVQFGVAATPTVHEKWQDRVFVDEPNKVPFRAGTLSFAGAGENSRTCHLFVALEPNGAQLGNAPHEATLGHLDAEGIRTFEQVVANHRRAGYGDTGHLQSALVTSGNDAAAEYPKLDRILRCSRLKEEL